MRKKLNLTILLVTAFLLFSCNDDFQRENPNLNLAPAVTQKAENSDNETFVSSKQALEIAEKFFSRESGAATRAFASAKVETVKDVENGNQPAFHVVNYPEGGWAIVSATKNYFPILAYSDENAFDLEATSKTGVSVWFEETKEAIRVSEALDAENKAQIPSQWLSYETRDASSLPQTRSYTLMSNRINHLTNLYFDDGWFWYMSLEDAQWYLSYSEHQNMLDMANYFGSPPEYTIFAMKNGFYNYQKGPLFSTKWHQDPPYNDFCPTDHLGRKYDAGCAAIAMAMVLKHHKYSASPITWNGHTVNWNDLPDNAYYDNNGCLNTTNSVKALIRHAADKASMNWGFGIFGTFSWTLPGNVANGLRSYGYTVDKTSHNASIVRNEIIANRPVIMVGFPSIINPNGHYWVCNGVKIVSSGLQYFIEYLVGGTYNNYYTNNYGYSPDNPGGAGSTIFYYHMNWGWGGSFDGWFFENSYPSGKSYGSYRENLYISK